MAHGENHDLLFRDDGEPQTAAGTTVATSLVAPPLHLRLWRGGGELDNGNRRGDGGGGWWSGRRRLEKYAAAGLWLLDSGDDGGSSSGAREPRGRILF